MALSDREGSVGTPAERDVELLQGVDSEVVTGAVGAVVELVDVVEPAVATLVAVTVESNV